MPSRCRRTTGLRGALSRLRWSDVDLDRGRLTVAHTVTEVRGRKLSQERRRQPLGPVAPAALTGEHQSRSPTITLSIYAHELEQDDQTAAELVAGAILGA